MMKKKIALFHPWIKSKGGAERVVLELMEKSKHQIDLFTWVYDRDNTFEAFKRFKINVIAPKFVKKLSRLHILRGLFIFFSFFSKIPLENYDLFLISTSGVGEFVTFRNYKKEKTYAFIHTPLREANEKIVKWNLENRYKGFFKKQTYLFLVRFYRILEKIAWKKIDFPIFNSELTRQRAKEHNLIKNKKTKVINPPINFSRFVQSKKQGNHFVYVSRLNIPKRQDILIKAWSKFVKRHPKYRLILVGTPDNKNYFDELKKLAKKTKNVEIRSNISDRDYENTVATSIAGIFLGYKEDFGMVPLETVCVGKPLIAVDEGGYVDLIKDHPLFYKIKERHNNEEMIGEIERVLENFVEDKKRRKSKKIKLKNFTEEMDKVLK